MVKFQIKSTVSKEQIHTVNADSITNAMIKVGDLIREDKPNGYTISQMEAQRIE